MLGGFHTTLTCRCHGVRMHRLARTVCVLVVLGFGGIALPACTSSSSPGSTAPAGETVAESAIASDTVVTDTTAPAADATAAESAPVAQGSTDMTSGLKGAKWASNVKVTIADGTFRFVSDGLPNHVRQAEYALPNAGVCVPDASTATAGADPTTAQSYDYSIPTVPTKNASPTDASLGTIGVMISGAALFNPYEGDGSTVAMASNFTVKNAKGEEVAFLDSCNGHPTPMGQFHDHALRQMRHVAGRHRGRAVAHHRRRLRRLPDLRRPRCQRRRGEPRISSMHATASRAPRRSSPMACTTMCSWTPPTRHLRSAASPAPSMRHSPRCRGWGQCLRRSDARRCGALSLL